MPTNFIIITEMSNKSMEHVTMKEQSLAEIVTIFLIDLVHANRSPHTRHAYATDLERYYGTSLALITI